MQVHLFGATSSPSCACYALQRTARDNKYEYDEETVNTVYKNFYVDDCLKSHSSVERVKKLVSQLRELLAKGRFHLTKWASNSREVLAPIPTSERATSMVDLDLESLPDSVVLGIVELDTFQFRIIDKENVNTRRKMLSYVSSPYDPLGVASPFILLGKQILQRLCHIDYDWDEKIGKEELDLWNSWRNLLSPPSRCQWRVECPISCWEIKSNSCKTSYNT